MMHFGGTLTLNGIVAYIGFNADKVMIGRFLGVDVLGIYGRGFAACRACRATILLRRLVRWRSPRSPGCRTILLASEAIF